MHADEFLQLADALPEALILLSTDGEILAANKKASQFLQSDRNDVIGQNLQTFSNSPPEKLNAALRAWSRSRSAIPAALNWKTDDKQGWRCQGFLLTPKTKTSRAQLVLRCIPGKQTASEFIALNHELERQKKTLRKLLESREQWEKEHELALVTLESIGDAVITTDSQARVKYLNPIAESLTGWKSEEACNKPITEVFKIINELTRELAVEPVSRCLAEGKIVGLANHTVLISKFGKEYVIEDSAAPIRDRKGVVHGVVLVFRDVTNDRMARRQLEYLAQHDTLTGLNNRHYFEHQLEHVVQLVTRDKSTCALFYIDLDQFKIINDTAGHAAGDSLLTEVAHLFAGRLRKGDILARLGGDEFGVLLEHVPLDMVDNVARSYISALEGLHFNWDGKQYDITPSLGISIIDQHTKSAAEALREADIACYIAKRDGRNRYHLYESNDEAGLDTLGEMGLVNDIRNALVSNNFELYQQPIVETGSGKVVINEILLRLYSHEQDVISPASFIPVAERYGIMPMVDQWVVSHALTSLKEQLAEGDQTIMSINLSGASFGDSELLDIFKTRIGERPEIAKYIMLEVTETAAVRHIEKAIDFMHELCGLGICFALDDFGTGFSSFAYLKHLPVEVIKIDGTFVRDMMNDPVDQAMVRSINHIAHSLDKKTIAEFVENEEILNFLGDIGVDMVQGYHIGYPAPIK
ncbi:MAG: EAL domain-containing protein [Gammaproteobacteria bacterium]|nr:EAL domain-containing protein [Gammaproteobacteria bacterium]